MAAILNFTIMNLAILDSAILVFPLKLTHTCQDWFPPFANKKTSLIHSDSTLMMAAILNTAMLDSDTLLSSVGFTQKHSNCTLTLTQPNSIWLICWWQPSCILPSWIQSFCTKLWLKLIHSDLCDDGSHLEFCHVEFCHLGLSHFAQNSDSNKFNLTQSHSFSFNLMMSSILNSAILDSTILNNKKLHSFILTQPDDGSHLEFYHLGFRHFA